MIGTLLECIKDMEDGVCNFCIDGKCVGCGACCSDLLPLSYGEIRDIKRYVKKKHIQPTIRTNAPSKNPLFDLTCPFLDDSKECEKCKIYAVRPAICRKFKCDTPPSKIKENKELFWRTRKPYSMRQVFFGE